MHPLSTIAAGSASVLLQAALKPSLLLAAGWAAALALRSKPSSLRHLTWTLALAGALLLPLLSAIVPGWTLPLPALAGPPAVREPAAAAGGKAARHSPAFLTGARAGMSSATAGSSATGPARLPPRRSPAAIGSGAGAAKGAIASSAAMGVGGAGQLESWRAAPARSGAGATAGLSRWAMLVWLAGAFGLAGRRVLAARQLSALARRATSGVDPAWTTLLQQECRRLGVARPVLLLFDDCAAVPLTWGLVAPVVLLPATADRWPQARRASVLLHELAHVRRGDARALLIAQLACAAYWWNPLAWLAARRMRAEAERACDDQVLAAGLQASRYASDLLEIASVFRRERRVDASSTPAAASSSALAMARSSQLEARLVAILDPRQRRGALGRRGVVGALLAGLLVLLPLAALRPAGAQATAVAAAGLSTPSSSRRGGLPGRGQAASPSATLAPAAVVGRGSAGEGLGLCPPGRGTRRHTSSSDIDGTKSLEISWSGEGCSVELRARGDVRFNADLTDVASIPAGGSLDIELRQGGSLTRLEVEPGTRGQLLRAWTVAGQKRPFDAGARAWLARLLVEADRNSGFAADSRFPLLLAQGGAAGVLDEISRIDSDYAASIYYRKLLASGRLDRGTMRRLIDQAGRGVHSDYELARILTSASERADLGEEATRSAFLSALDHLESDYEHARVLMILIERGTLQPPLAAKALRSAARLRSDYELARVLVAMSQRKLVDEAEQLAYLDATAKLSSDYQRGRALQALLQAGRLRQASALALLRLAGAIGSDHEKAGVLIDAARGLPADAAVRSALQKAALGVSSEFERRRVLDALSAAPMARAEPPGR